MARTLKKGHRRRISAALRRKWRDPEFRARTLSANQSPAALAKRSESLKRAWGDPAFRAERKAAMDRHYAPARAAKAGRLEQAKLERAAAQVLRRESVESWRGQWEALARRGPPDKAAREDFISECRGGGLTFSDIGAICEISKQRVQAIFFLRCRREGRPYQYYERPRLTLPEGAARPC